MRREHYFAPGVIDGYAARSKGARRWMVAVAVAVALLIAGAML